ncbi:MAG: tetratricopeptide repeat protein, partial [Myxococcales bacterium]|nr:tetratricopeptide repeat protein [Myxococcales bacterium]
MIAGLSSLLGGCYGATLERMEDQLSAQRREIQVLRESFEAQRQSLRGMRDRLALLEDKAESAALHGGYAPRPLPVVKLSPPVEAEPEDAEESAYTITQADVEPRSRRSEPRAVEPPANAAFAGNIGVVPVASPVAAPREATPAPKAEVPRGEGILGEGDDTQPMDQALLAFRRARGLYDRGNIAAATVAFEGFVRDYPQHDFADNALFLLGQARFEQARYPAALKAFRSVVEEHP